MINSNQNNEFKIELNASQTYALIREYYKKYEGFDGEIQFDLYSKGFNDGWGFTDYYGRINLIFIEKIKIGDTISEIKTTLDYEKISTKKIFQPFFEDAGYELTGTRCFDFDVSNYGNKVRFNSLTLYAKKKINEKVLKK